MPITRKKLYLGALTVASLASANVDGAEFQRNNDVVRHYAALANDEYADAVASAEVMQRAIALFLQDPSPRLLLNARRQWTVAHEIYGYTEAFRFFAGPIDDARGLEKRINAWPIDAAYLDYTHADPEAGLVNHPESDERSGFVLSATGLAAMNQRESERNISTGWHAVEFLLWGEDLSATGPGDRPYTDYALGKSRHAERRARLLKAVALLLVADLKTVRDEWAISGKRYGARFVADPDALRAALIGFSTLAGPELGGERLSTALHTQSQEEEQSCFSDTTTRDINANIAGLEIVWTGRYRRYDGTYVDGPGLRQAVTRANVSLAGKIDVALAATARAGGALHNPFDQEIIAENPEGQMRVATLIQELEGVADLGKQATRAMSAK